MGEHRRRQGLGPHGPESGQAATRATMSDVADLLVQRLIEGGALADIVTDWCGRAQRSVSECVVFFGTPERAQRFDGIRGLRVTVTGGAVALCTGVENTARIVTNADDAAKVAAVRASSSTAMVVAAMFGSLAEVRAVEPAKGNA